MAIFDNNANVKKVPLGVALIRKGLIKDSDIDKAIEYQRLHKGIKLGEAFHALQLCNDQDLINTIGEVIGFKAVQIDPASFRFNFTKYISMDIVCGICPRQGRQRADGHSGRSGADRHGQKIRRICRSVRKRVRFPGLRRQPLD